jgi:4-amino-4-deoxy-L-arabinose transferase-like glycosyltransferase
LVLASIALASAVRLVYGLLVNDPMGGADADTYHAAGEVIAGQGLFSDSIPGVPYWPAGYPALVGATYWLVGSVRAVVVLQVLLLAVGTYCAYRLTATLLDERTGVVAAVLLSASPALVAAPTVLMYEVPLGVAMVGAFLLLARAAAGRPIAPAVGAGVLLAVAAAIQPKALLPAILGALWLSLTTRRHVAATLVLLLALCGPAALAARTVAAEGEPVAAATLGVTMRIGMHDGADGGYQPTPAPTGPTARELADEDGELLRASLRWATENPRRALVLTGPKALNFWSPLAGSEGSRGTWFHSFDLRRVLPPSGGLATLWSLFRALWTTGTIALMAAGAVVVWRRRPASCALLAIPVLSFLAISLVTIGDPRFRLPVAPFYTALIAAAVVAGLNLSIRGDRSDRAPGATPA